MPDGAADNRAKMAASLAGTIHQKLTSDRLWEAILAAAEAAKDSGNVLEVAQAREAKRDAERARRIPESLARALAEASSLGTTAWQKARKASDFSAFAGHLERLLALAKEKAAALDPHGNAYDALLDGFEPGATEAELAPVFDDLVAELSPLVREIAESGRTVDESPVAALPRRSAARPGAPRGRCIRLRLRPWPARSLDPPVLRRRHAQRRAHDLALPGRRPALGALRRPPRVGPRTLRAGHPGRALAHAAGRRRVARHPRDRRSRLWENQVGRSRGFWRWLWPQFRSSSRSTPRDESGGALAGAPHGAAVADPRRGRRGDLQPPHRHPLRASSGALLRRPRRSPTCPRPGTTATTSSSASVRDRRRGRAAGHPLVAGAVRLLPHLHPRHPGSAQLFAAAGARLGPLDDAFAAASSRRSSAGCATKYTATGAATRRRSWCSAPRAAPWWRTIYWLTCGIRRLGRTASRARATRRDDLS